MAKLSKVKFLKQLYVAKSSFNQDFNEEAASKQSGLPISRYGTEHGQWLVGFFTACSCPESNDAFDVLLLTEMVWEEYLEMPVEITDAAWSASQWAK